MVDHRYHINIMWREAEQCWIADVPDLKPCSATGVTPEKAVDAVLPVIASWIDAARANGLPIPEPSYRPAIYQG